MSTAASIGANKYWLAAANSLGVATGKMMAPQSIAIGLVAVDEAGRDGELLKKYYHTLLYSLLLVHSYVLWTIRMGNLWNCLN